MISLTWIWIYIATFSFLATGGQSQLDRDVFSATTQPLSFDRSIGPFTIGEPGAISWSGGTGDAVTLSLAQTAEDASIIILNIIASNVLGDIYTWTPPAQTSSGAEYVIQLQQGTNLTTSNQFLINPSPSAATTSSASSSSLTSSLRSSQSVAPDVTTTTSSSLSSTTTTSPASTLVSSNGGTLSDPAKIGVGVGVSVGGILILAGIAWALYSRKQRQRFQARKDRGPGVAVMDEPGVAVDDEPGVAVDSKYLPDS